MNLIQYVGEGKERQKVERPGYEVGPDPAGNLWAAPMDFFRDGVYDGHLPQVATMRPQERLDPFGGEE